MAHSLAGKTAIVTGAGSGINLAFTRLLLSRQCNVLLADLSLRPEAREVVKLHSRSTRLSSGRAVFQQTDVTKWRDLQRMFEVARQEFAGRVGIVCPGAGVYEPTWSAFWDPPSSPLSKDDPDGNAYASFDINLNHPVRTTQLAIRQHLSKGKPATDSLSIVHISSIAGQCTPFHAPLYNASKHALNGFVRSLAPLQSRMGIRVACVAPGVIKTPLWTDNPDKLSLMGREDVWVSPEDVAETMSELATAERLAVQGVGADEFPEGKREVEIEGGMVVEVSAGGRRRVVKQYMDPGPEGRAGNTVDGIPGETEAILARLERGGF